MKSWSWTETQALGVRAASGAGVPPAQALAFGAMLARHLADDGAEAPLMRALTAPDAVLGLAHRVETVVEQASVGGNSVTVEEADAGQRALLISWLSALPCEADLSVTGNTITAKLDLAAPSLRSRPARITLSDDLAADLHALASKTYVPDSDTSRASGAGAGLMELD
ncbi:MAG: hypothetical protein AAFQ19_16625 [Pseudomonadota bacterium]